jgi:hypothetical protein
MMRRCGSLWQKRRVTLRWEAARLGRGGAHGFGGITRTYAASENRLHPQRAARSLAWPVPRTAAPRRSAGVRTLCAYGLGQSGRWHCTDGTRVLAYLAGTMVLHGQYPCQVYTRTRGLGNMARHGTPSGTARGTIGLGAKYQAKERGTVPRLVPRQAARHDADTRHVGIKRHVPVPMIVRRLALGA